MHIALIARLALAVTVGWGCVSCSSHSASSNDDGSSHPCHLVGCQDVFAATITMSGSTLMAGVHTIETSAGTSGSSTTRSCTVTVTQAFLDGARDSLDQTTICDDGIRVEVRAETTCATIVDGGAVSTSSASCVRVPDHFIESVSIADLPSSVHIRQTFGDATIVDESRTITYASFSPNGPTCEPTCHVGGFELALP